MGSEEEAGILGSSDGGNSHMSTDVSNRRDVFEKLQEDKLGYAFSVWRMEGAFHSNQNVTLSNYLGYRSNAKSDY